MGVKLRSQQAGTSRLAERLDRSREVNSMPGTHPVLAAAEAFCAAYGLRAPILLAPMAGACPPSLSIAVARAGGLGACGALLMQPDAIAA